MKGAQGNDPNKGGTWRWEDIKVSLTDANHPRAVTSSNISASLAASCSSSRTASASTSPATRTPSAKRWRSSGGSGPSGAAIGDHYTMGPKEAAVALELLGVTLRAVPLRHIPGVARDAAGAAGARAQRRGTHDRAGRHDHAVGQRWWGATGRRVPEISVEGELPLEEAVVLEGVGNPDILREAHRSGSRSSCVRRLHRR